MAVYSRSGYPDEGSFVISNYSTNKVLQLENADTIAGTNVAQYTETGDTSQHWNITYTGNGCYKISPVLSPDKALGVLDCSTSGNANVQIGKYEEKACQQWHIANMGSGIYRIMALHSRRALEIAGGSASEGANAQQNSYRESRLYQRWRFKVPTVISTIGSTIHENEGFSILPNPSDGSFTIDLTNLTDDEVIHLEVFNVDGRLVYSNIFENQNTIGITHLFDSGIYQVRIIAGDRVMTQKLIVK